MMSRQRYVLGENISKAYTDRLIADGVIAPAKPVVATPRIVVHYSGKDDAFSSHVILKELIEKGDIEVHYESVLEAGVVEGNDD